MKFIFLLIIFFPPISTQFLDIQKLINNYENAMSLTIFMCNRKDTLQLRNNLEGQYFEEIVSKNITHPKVPKQSLYIIDMNCPKTAHILDRAESMQLFSAPTKWIIYHKTRDIGGIVETLSNYDILVDSDVTILASNSAPIKIYKRGKYEQLQIDSNLINRYNLMGVTINTSLVVTNNDTLNHMTDKRDKHIDSVTKVNYVLVEYLSDFMNAKLNYSFVNTWGYFDKNTSTWSGMIGKLTAGDADVGGTPLFLTGDRISIIDYLALTTPTGSKFIFRQPKLSYVTNVYTLPFDTLVWICILILLLIIAVILYLVVKWEKTYLDRRETEMEKVSFVGVCLVTFGALCQQGTATTPTSYPGRIVVLFLFVSFMFMYTSYSANIVALLQSSSTSIQTLKDLLNSRLDVGVDDTVFNHFYFPSSTEPVRRALYQQKVAPPNQRAKFYPIEEGIKKMRQGLFAFHVETGPGYKVVVETFREDEKCGLQEIQFLQYVDTFLAVRKNSSYKEIIRVGLRLLQTTGIQSREVGLIYTKRPPCLSRGSSFISVGIVDCYPAAVVLAGGFSLATVILVIEIYANKQLLRCNKRTR